MDRPWTRPGWGEDAQLVAAAPAPSVPLPLPPVAAEVPSQGKGEDVSAPTLPSAIGSNRPHLHCIRVDPDQVEGFRQRLMVIDHHEDDDASPVTEANDSPFLHDSRWVDLVCAQIHHQSFGVIRLPRYYAGLYRELMEPSLYPPEVTETERMRMMQPDQLPARLVALSKIWGYLCECICRLVTRRLLSPQQTAALQSPWIGMTCTPHTETLKGLLRISYSGSAHAQHGHYDASYTTMLGPGSVAGCLQFAETGGDGENFVPSERMLERTGSDGLDGANFFIFTGVKHGSVHSTIKPLRHRVVSPSCEEDNRTRINVIYFLNTFYTADDSATVSSGRAHQPLKPESEATFEINSFSSTRIIQHARYLCWPPQSCCLATDEAMEEATLEATQADQTSSWTTRLENWDEDQAIDWNGDGL